MEVKKNEATFEDILNFYQKTLLKEYFPNFKIQNSIKWSFASALSEEVQNGTLPNLISNRNYYQSNYYLDQKTDFIHYTSLDAVFNIIKTNQIRLYDLSQVNDPKEIKFFEDYIGEIIDDFELYIYEDNEASSFIDRLGRFLVFQLVKL